MKKSEYLLPIFIVFSVLLLMLAGCEKKTCPKGEILINDTCCADLNYNYICDINEDVPICGNGECEETENCSNCWQDCGVCKKYVYVYVPGNFSLNNLTENIGLVYRKDLKFRKDIEVNDSVADFYYYEEKIPRYLADFKGVKYHPKVLTKMIVLSRVKLDNWYLNQSSRLLNLTNRSEWYLVDKPLQEERQRYINRITRNKATEDYPRPRTGHEKLNKYDEWVFMNYSTDEDIFYDNITLLENDMVWRTFASIEEFDINYQTGSYEEPKTQDDPGILIYQYDTVTENKLNYINSLSFVCARNLAITLYDYDYDVTHYNIKEERLHTEVKEAKDRLLRKAERLKRLCKHKYSTSVFMP